MSVEKAKAAAGKDPYYYQDDTKTAGGGSIVQMSGITEGDAANPAAPPASANYYVSSSFGTSTSLPFKWQLSFTKDGDIAGLLFNTKQDSGNEEFDNQQAKAVVDTHNGLHRATLTSNWASNVFSGTLKVHATATAVVLTDFDETAGATVGADPDYLSFGYWRTERSSMTVSAHFNQWGAFAYGRDPTTRGEIETLSQGATKLGEVTYTGTVAGARVSQSGQSRLTDFTSTVTLNANFDDTDTTDTTFGSIDGSIPLDDGRTLILDSTAITAAASGFGQWSHTTQLEDSSDNVHDPASGYTGKWGGGFFGANAESAAGTFSATSTAVTYLGAFMGTRPTE